MPAERLFGWQAALNVGWRSLRLKIRRHITCATLKALSAKRLYVVCLCCSAIIVGERLGGVFESVFSLFGRPK